MRGILVCALIAAGCVTTTKGGQSSSSTSTSAGTGGIALPAPWTDTFLESQLLTANEVRIEGPEGLIAHVATRLDPADHKHVEKTIPEGFYQETTVLPGEDRNEIRAQIDNLVIAATRKLVILERPGPVDVSVTATGDAFWKNQKTNEEQRGASLRLHGKIVR